MTHKKFTARFPEFVDTSPALIKYALMEAKDEINKKAFGKNYYIALYYLAAHKLAISPMGESVRLEAKQNKNIYQLEYERLCQNAFMGARVI